MTPTLYSQVLAKGEVVLKDVMGSDLTVVNAARVSFDKESSWDETKGVLSKADQKLIRFLAVYNHWTPFAHPQITLRIKAPIFIRTQFFKHKQGFVENEISRRYVTTEVEVYEPQWRGKPKGSAKQGSSDFIDLEAGMLEEMRWLTGDAISVYESLIRKGVAPEQARSVLPQGTYTQWYWTGSLAAYARFYKQRSDPHAQWEIREYAKAIGELIQSRFPYSWRALTGEKSQ